MDSEKIYYRDSWGRRHVQNRAILKAILAKKRKFKFVLPEVVEVVDRLKTQAIHEPQKLTVESLSMELFINPAVVYSVLKYLERVGLLKHEPASSEHKTPLFPDVDQPWACDRFAILRDVEDKDYGQDAKAKEA